MDSPGMSPTMDSPWIVLPDQTLSQPSPPHLTQTRTHTVLNEAAFYFGQGCHCQNLQRNLGARWKREVSCRNTGFKWTGYNRGNHFAVRWTGRMQIGHDCCSTRSDDVQQCKAPELAQGQNDFCSTPAPLSACPHPTTYQQCW